MTVAGRFPSLEHIGEHAFKDLQGTSVSIDLPFGAPALRCLGPFAFAGTDWQSQLTLKGDFPCLLATVHKDRVNDRSAFGTFNAFDDIFGGLAAPLSTENVMLRVKECKPGAAARCVETTAHCNSVHGFAESDHCEFNDGYELFSFASFASFFDFFLSIVVFIFIFLFGVGWPLYFDQAPCSLPLPLL